jgi:hypothetical protein
MLLTAQQPLRRRDDARRLAQGMRIDAADLRRDLGRVGLDGLLEVVVADRVRVDVAAVDAADVDQLADERVHQREVRPRRRGEMDVGLPGHRRLAWVDADQLRRPRPAPAVEHPHPQHRLRRRDVVPVQADRVGVADVLVAAGLSVAAEGLLERLAGRGRAHSRVAVEVVGADARAPDERLRRVLLEHQLTAGVTAERRRAALGKQRFRAFHDETHGGVPVGRLQFALTPHQWPRQAVRAGVGLPAEEVLGAEPAAVDAVLRAPAHADDPPVLDGDVHRVPVGVQQRCRRHPAVDLVLGDPVRQLDVDPHRPLLAGAIGGSFPPRVGDARMRHPDVVERT